MIITQGAFGTNAVLRSRHARGRSPCSRITRSDCAAPVCNPSRAALMSGLRPSTTGVYENNNDWRTVIIGQDLPLTTTFRKAGYEVHGAGKIHHEAYRPAEGRLAYRRG